VRAVDLECGGEASGAPREIKKSTGLAVFLHEFEALERFDCTDQDRGSCSGRLAHNIQHEVRAVIEKNVGVTGREIHRTDSRSRAAEVMSRGITGRIGLRLHDAPAEASGGEIVDDNFSDKETSEFDSVRWKLATTQTVDR